MNGFLRGIMLALLIATPASAQASYPDPSQATRSGRQEAGR
jgi:hypothetical protein